MCEALHGLLLAMVGLNIELIRRLGRVPAMADKCKCKVRYDDGYTWWNCSIHGKVTADEYENEDIDDEEDRTPRREAGGRKKASDKTDDTKTDGDDTDDGDKDKKGGKPPVKDKKTDDGDTDDSDGDGDGERRRSRTGWWD